MELINLISELPYNIIHYYIFPKLNLADKINILRHSKDVKLTKYVLNSIKSSVKNHTMEEFWSCCRELTLSQADFENYVVPFFDFLHDNNPTIKSMILHQLLLPNDSISVIILQLSENCTICLPNIPNLQHLLLAAEYQLEEKFFFKLAVFGQFLLNYKANQNRYLSNGRKTQMDNLQVRYFYDHQLEIPEKVEDIFWKIINNFTGAYANWEDQYDHHELLYKFRTGQIQQFNFDVKRLASCWVEDIAHTIIASNPLTLEMYGLEPDFSGHRKACHEHCLTHVEPRFPNVFLQTLISGLYRTKKLVLGLDDFRAKKGKSYLDTRRRNDKVSERKAFVKWLQFRVADQKTCYTELELLGIPVTMAERKMYFSVERFQRIKTFAGEWARKGSKICKI